MKFQYNHNDLFGILTKHWPLAFAPVALVAQTFENRLDKTH
jgi:hypothetical protein